MTLSLYKYLLSLSVLFNHYLQIYSENNTIISYIPAVQVFLFLSGYLVAGSFERISSFKRYLLRRLFRVWPALGAFSLLFGLLYFLMGYTSIATSAAYIFRVSTFTDFLQPCINTLSFPRSSCSLNPSLWSLRLECLLYLLLPCFAFLFKFNKSLAILFLLAPVLRDILVCISVFQSDPYLDSIIMFLAGCSLYYLFRIYHIQTFFFLQKFPPVAVFWFFLVISLSCSFLLNQFILSLFLIVSLVPIYVTLIMKVETSRSSKFFGDISYSLYIYHFPVLYTLLLCLSSNESRFGYFNEVIALLFAAVASHFLAAISFYAVESRAYFKL